MNIFRYFENSVLTNPNGVCLFVGERQFSYAELDNMVTQIAGLLLNDKEPFVGILACRSLTAYAGILAVLKSGKGYVPLSPRFPEERNKIIKDLAGFKTLIVGKECLHEAKYMLKDNKQLALIFPFIKKAEIKGLCLSSYNIYTQEDLTSTKVETACTGKGDYAYMLFTSGSTGTPKGVPISHGNVRSYIDYLANRYKINNSDKFSQLFDLTFDLSVHDLFLCWQGGAELHCIPEKSTMAPAKFIKDNELTFWFSVPSVGQFMSRFKMLKPGVFPNLKYSLFCGESLPASIADEWQHAAPNSVVENIYGPTEATIGISNYLWNPEKDRNKTHNGIVSIGKVFSTQEFAIVNEKNRLIQPGEEGELCLAGSQVAIGYWNNQSKTREFFVRLSQKGEEVWYKTGDIVKVDVEGDIYYVSRKDCQVKIRGFRIDLAEIDYIISEFTGETPVVSVPFPVDTGIVESIYTFVPATLVQTQEDILCACRRKLPDYMIPQGIITIEEFPHNANGKIDRNKLSSLIRKRYVQRTDSKSIK